MVVLVGTDLFKINKKKEDERKEQKAIKFKEAIDDLKKSSTLRYCFRLHALL